MACQIKVTNSLLAFWRHELFAPINIIKGYSELVIEDLAESLEVSNQENLYSLLGEVKQASQDIYETINTILDVRLLSNSENIQDVVSLSSLLETHITPKTDQINQYIGEILWQIPPDFTVDINKIQKAVYKLQNLLDKKNSWSEYFSEFNTQEIHSKSTNSEKNKKGGELCQQNHNNPINFDVEKSMKLSESDYDKDNVLSQGSRILIVDNNTDNQELLYRHLEREGHFIDTTDSGEEALRLIAQKPYDIILLDIIMPGLNGYQVLSYLKHHSEWRTIPVIMISSLNEINSITKCIKIGAEDYLPKPFNITLLRARIDTCLQKKRFRDQEKVFMRQLSEANQEISHLNEQLKTENMRLSSELEITRRLQQLILPRNSELHKLEGIDISGFMEPAEEVGGDYYDVHQYNGSINISIGDVTGHGLESGLLMIMAQTAVRTLIENNETDQKRLLNTLNSIISNNAKRIDSDRNLTLSILNYFNGTLKISGQHEDIIIVRTNGEIERIDTTYLGFPIGLEEDISKFLSQAQLSLESGDVVALYTDGITEAENISGTPYGVDRLCQVIQHNRYASVSEIKNQVINDLRNHIDNHKVLDDLTLLILKQK